MRRPSPLTKLQGNRTLQVLLTLLIGGIGAFTAEVCGLPAAALIGATLAVSVCSFLRVPTHIPSWLRNTAFAAIGCSLGSGVSRDLVELAVKWPISLCGLVVVMGIILFCSSWILTSLFRQTRETAILAASPGALSYSLAMAATGVGDARSIIVIQSIRLLSITTALPMVLDLLQLRQAGGQSATATHIGAMATAALFLLTLLLGFILAKKRLPAAFLIAGVVISGVAHYIGWVEGRPQSAFLILGFVITGSVIGARFTSIPLSDIRRLLVAAMAVVLVSTAIAAFFAVLAAKFLSLPFGQVWVSYAPGGVEAMAAMAIAMGYDSTFVATHHLFRIILLLFLLPALLKIFKSSTSGVSIEGRG